MLADDKLISQEIAVLRLIDISKKIKYTRTIKIAFIKRMKTPLEKEIEKINLHKLQIKIKTTDKTNAQYIFLVVERLVTDFADALKFTPEIL